MASYKEQIGYLLSEVYYQLEETREMNLIIKEFVNINKKWANIDPLDRNQHEIIIQEKHNSVTPTLKESTQLNKDNERIVASNQDVDVPNMSKSWS